MPRQVTSREFNQNPSAIKTQAGDGPVIITERGKEAYVVMKYTDYEDLTSKGPSVLESLHMPGAEDIELENVRTSSTSRTIEF